MQNVFEFRNSVIREYESYSRSFVTIRAADIAGQIDGEYKEGRYWPDPLIQINPGYKRCETVQQLVSQGLLHPKCGEIFKLGKSEGQSKDVQLYQHQLEAIAKARSYVLTTGKFRFCVNCGQNFDAAGKDINRLAGQAGVGSCPEELEPAQSLFPSSDRIDSNSISWK